MLFRLIVQVARLFEVEHKEIINKEQCILFDIIILITFSSTRYDSAVRNSHFENECTNLVKRN